jgi:hypothetical protein
VRAVFRPVRRHPITSLLVLVVGVSLGLLAVLPAETQDLAELARKEKERRAKVANPTKVLVEEDAKADASGNKPGALTTMPEPSPGSPRPAAVAAPDAQKAGWKARSAEARSAIQRAQDALAAAEREVEAYGSDRAVLSAKEAQDPMRLQKREATLRDLIAKANLQREALANAKKAQVALEEEARRSGIPPGWLR